ncbi:transcriptional regulator [Actinomadura craniellae]|uniref:Transcriptional regulator n=1 Tax=Actinomadura craniellae TaxID=2231787 RepID=A0A365H139_9ACTN|nr:helix-turn-helix domain-containing protein [Actinomadura craniellae]RAY12759.1 transcriptional regulator [Actinomadura craniellae]
MAGSELGAFLRSRREAVAPAEAGFPNGSRRRTPGLRRAELATLAGVSVEYLTRLEQGRDRRPSPEIIGALAEALSLSADETVHMHRLVKSGDGRCQWAGPPARTVRPTVRALLDRLEPAPAIVADRLGEVLAWTTGYERLAAPVGLLDVRPPHLARFVFTDDRARTVYPDWERVADERAAALRAAAALGDPYAADLAKELTAAAGASFGDRFTAPGALPGYTGVERWAHPVAGELRLAYESLELPDADEQRLVVYLPADDAASTALDHLTAG